MSADRQLEAAELKHRLLREFEEFYEPSKASKQEWRDALGELISDLEMSLEAVTCEIEEEEQEQEAEAREEAEEG